MFLLKENIFLDFFVDLDTIKLLKNLWSLENTSKIEQKY